jgi:hypothetical protein
MLRNTHRVIVGLASSFVLLAVAQFTRSTEAALRCTDLKGCTGNLECSEYAASGSSTTCLIQCSDGTKIQCGKAGGS